MGTGTVFVTIGLLMTRLEHEFRSAAVLEDRSMICDDHFTQAWGQHRLGVKQSYASFTKSIQF